MKEIFLAQDSLPASDTTNSKFIICSKCMKIVMNAQSTPQVTDDVSSAGKYLTFSFGGEAYGISVLRVRELVRHTRHRRAVAASPREGCS